MVLNIGDKGLAKHLNDTDFRAWIEGVGSTFVQGELKTFDSDETPFAITDSDGGVYPLRRGETRVSFMAKPGKRNTYRALYDYH